MRSYVKLLKKLLKGYFPDLKDPRTVIDLERLERRGLVELTRAFGGDIVNIRVTIDGEIFLEEHRERIWDKIWTTLVSLVVGFVLGFLSAFASQLVGLLF